MTPLVEVSGLSIDYVLGSRRVRALDDASLTLQEGETIGIVGESGSGKSTLGSALGRLLPRVARATSGSITVAGHSVLDLNDRDLRDLRKRTLGFIPQDPVGALDPTMRLDRQLALAVGPFMAGTSTAALVELLTSVQIAEPERVLRLFPHQISGGMAQRIAVAMAMAKKPRLLIADEPTAALDSQIREDISRLIFTQAQSAGASIIWLSHDLTAVARWCGRIAVMYAGRVVEEGPASVVLEVPGHPYTSALAGSDPGRAVPGERLTAIQGEPPVLTDAALGCAFAPRCPIATDVCRVERPPAVTVGRSAVLCHHPEKLVHGAVRPAATRSGV